MFKPPIILEIKTLARTKKFHIQGMDLRFSNGVECSYERLQSSNTGAVLIVPMLDNDRVLLIYEYSAGTNKYELALPKGKIDQGEDILQAANRELIEEVGYGARQLTQLKSMTLAPGYQSSTTHIVLAQNLYPKTAQGDEPEPLVVVERSLSNIAELVMEIDLTEARSIAALYLAKQHINH